MITIKKIEVGYGAFCGDRLIAVEEKPENYQFLINHVVRANKEVAENGSIISAIENLKSKIDKLKDELKKSLEIKE